MKRFFYFAALVAALILASLPAIADHANEPTAPVVGLSEMRVFDYPHLVTLIPCDGSAVVTFDEARAEVSVLVAGKPSEHFRVSLAYYLGGIDRRGRIVGPYQWSVVWEHQNVPPHIAQDHQNDWEIFQANQKFFDYTGPATFETKVLGDESGNGFTARCTFTVG